MDFRCICLKDFILPSVRNELPIIVSVAKVPRKLR